MKVTRLPVDTGTAAWNALLPQALPAVRLETQVTTDFLIVGAGFSGLAAARRLTQLDPSASIMVVDATRVGEGPAGRNSGFMIDLPHELSAADYATTQDNDRAQIALNRKAISFARDAVTELGISREAFDETGKVNGAAAEAAHRHNLDYADHLKRLGEPHEMLDADAMHTMTGSRFYRSGLYTPGTVLLQPATFVRGLADGLANRVTVFENTPVLSLERHGTAWLAKTPSGSISANSVILATNGHIESFGFFKREVFHVMLYASMTRPLSKSEDTATGEDRWGITPSDPAGTTLRKFRHGGKARIITRNQMNYVPEMEISPAHLESVKQRHIQSFANRYPALCDVQQEFVWSGRLCLSRNSAPAFGRLDDGLYAACCQNGLGTTRGTLSGMAAAEMAYEGETELVKTLLAQGSPKRLPPAPLDTLGANAFMRWSEFKARKEI